MTKDLDVLRVSVKIPARVENVDRAIKKLGGVAHLAKTIRKVHNKITKAQAMIEAARESKTTIEKPLAAAVNSDKKPEEPKVQQSRKFVS